MKMTTTMQMVGTTVVVVTPQKTKYPPKDQKFYKKKDEKKSRKMIIKKNRKEKMEGNNIYSQKEYGRHNGSQPFEIYDRFEVVDRDNLDVDRQFMTRKEYDNSILRLEVEWREFDDYMYGDHEVRQKRTRSESSDEETRPAKKMKDTFLQQMTEYRQAREDKLGECLHFCYSNSITLIELDTYNHSKGITRMDIIDYNQAKKEIEEKRHARGMVMDEQFWTSVVAWEQQNGPDPYDSDDDW